MEPSVVDPGDEVHDPGELRRGEDRDRRGHLTTAGPAKGHATGTPGCLPGRRVARKVDSRGIGTVDSRVAGTAWADTVIPGVAVVDGLTLRWLDGGVRGAGNPRRADLGRLDGLAAGHDRTLPAPSAPAGNTRQHPAIT
ncbi:hypothetical protein FrCorBMG51_00045 [Protofrankia coriariae]|uniref:Uncharacterized protein n=1 Tax=Protofrankia coriariae TaxID=1562887 RepID=A0ABR5F8N7_9ACTN|nr:hypothetical protein FrCorBMG51_00045 [Protofrankia coriariae]